VFRASGACRVDMVLTFFMVGSIYMLYGYLDSGKRGLPIGAIAMMTCAVLTKGPVGALLPLLSVGVYAVLSGEKLFSIVWRFALSAILSCVLPAVWYVLAYNQGGDDFLRLALEENFGRLTGTMSYASHEKPIIYNFGTVLLGVLPYTLLPLMALCKVHWRSLRTVSLRTFRERIASMTKIDLFAMVQIVVIFVFYCIPKSKRSVYMLPIYPFIAYFISLLVVYLCNNGAKLLKTFGWIISGVGIVVAVAGVVVSFDVWTAVLVDVIVLLSSAFLARFLVKSDIKKASLATVVNIVFIFVGISASVLPSLQNKKSDVKIARELEQIVPQGDIYQFVDDEMMRYYTINYYLNDRLRVFDRNDNMLPRTGYLLLSEADLPEWKARYENHYSIKTVYKSVSKSCDTKSMVILVSFVNKNYIK
jgi:4-amino-4-deoxy-L-arabinose transferase-like glycosyltransferase